MVLVGLEVDAVAGADHLDRTPLALAEPNPLGDEDRLSGLLPGAHGRAITFSFSRSAIVNLFASWAASDEVVAGDRT